MQRPTPILVTDPLPMRKGPVLALDDSADGFVVYFDPDFSEYILMTNMQYKET
jgi:hypothetical protein